MRVQLSIILMFFVSGLYAKGGSPIAAAPLCVVENKGQIMDQYGRPRKDIQFYMAGRGMNIYVGDGQLHYQFVKPILPDGNNNPHDGSASKTNIPSFLCFDVRSYRVDVELQGANISAPVQEEQPTQYYEQFFAGNGNEIRAYAYKKIVYKDVYPKIDWVIRIDGDAPAQEFVVREGGDPSQIKLKYKGQTSLSINDDGELIALTPMGSIKEHAPVCYCPDGRKVYGQYVQKGDVISYDAAAVCGGLVIDPTVEWATYYGVDSSNQFYAAACDNAGHVYACGLTWCTVNIATTGAFDTTYAGNGDAYLVKFDSSGHRLWATYYGGTEGDWGSAVACDPQGNVYLGGSTNSLEGISTPGCQQPFFGGGLWGGFLAKFTPSGTRRWGTYVGGTTGPYFDLEVASVSCDKRGHVYVSGATDDTANVATPGSFQPYKPEGMDTTIDCYLIQYDTAGIRQWGTYYGGGGRFQCFGGANSVDSNYVYLAGSTNDSLADRIATPGGFQPVLQGGANAFVAKFDEMGNRLWGTYYGGGNEATGGISTTRGYVYLQGTTSSDSAIATPGSYRTTRAGLLDMFLVKFDSVGNRIWGTYYGGPTDENVDYSRIITDGKNVYCTGSTTSLTGIATAGAWQPTYGGGDNDAFLAAFSSNGQLEWSTYYGGNGYDVGRATAWDGKAVYLCGLTNSPNNIATPNGFEPTGGGHTYYYPGFLAKFVTPDTSRLSAPEIASTENELHILPNPNNGSFVLRGTFENVSGPVQVTICDIYGRIVFNEAAMVANKRIEKVIKLDEGTTPGIYFMKVSSNNGTTTIKFLKR